MPSAIKTLQQQQHNERTASSHHMDYIRKKKHERIIRKLSKQKNKQTNHVMTSSCLRNMRSQRELQEYRVNEYH